MQIGELQFVKDQLWLSGLSSEGQPLPSQRAGSEIQQPEGFRREAADGSSAESRLQTGDSEVSRELESVCAGFSSLVLNTVSIKAKIQYFLVKLQPSQCCFPQWSCERRMVTGFRIGQKDREREREKEHERATFELTGGNFGNFMKYERGWCDWQNVKINLLTHCCHGNNQVMG